MATKKITSPPPAPAVAATPVDSKGNRRIYVDMPATLVTRLNVQAAMRSIPKRVLMAQLLADALTRLEGAKP